jgi:hypothetical protein
MFESICSLGTHTCVHESCTFWQNQTPGALCNANHCNVGALNGLHDLHDFFQNHTQNENCCKYVCSSDSRQKHSPLCNCSYFLAYLQYLKLHEVNLGNHSQTQACILCYLFSPVHLWQHYYHLYSSWYISCYQTTWLHTICFNGEAIHSSFGLWDGHTSSPTMQGS